MVHRLLLLIWRNLFIGLQVSPSFSLPRKQGEVGGIQKNRHLAEQSRCLHRTSWLFAICSTHIPPIFQCLNPCKLPSMFCWQQNLFLLLKTQEKGEKERAYQRQGASPSPREWWGHTGLKEKERGSRQSVTYSNDTGEKGAGPSRRVFLAGGRTC